MSEVLVKFADLCNFTPKQQEATERADEFQYHLYGGSRGPGKSFWLRWYALRELLLLAKAGICGARVGLFCEDYPSLKDRQISKISNEFPRWLGRLKDSKEDGLGFHLRPDYGGGMLALRNLDDPSKYQSSEFAGIFVDELTKNSLETFNVLRGSLRWPGVERPKFCGATNPGGIGHSWVRSYWIDGDFPPEMKGIGDRFAFTRALPDDNPHLPPDYWATLDSLPPDLARAWRHGDWDVFEGQFFGELRREVHGFAGEPPAGRIVCSLDYGESAPSALYWARVDCDGDVWVYRELYGPGMIYSALAERFRELSGDEKAEYVAASPDIFATSKGTGVVGSEILAGAGVPVVRADNNRVEGWRHMKEFIHHGRLHVSLDACPNFWRTVPAMVYDSARGEDMDGKGEDHAAESVRYLLMSRPRTLARAENVEIPGRSRAGIRDRNDQFVKVETDEYL